MIGEADTCRKYVEPKLDAAGWNTLPSSYTEQVTFTDGRIVVIGGRARRRPGRRADYLLRLRRDFPIAVVEAKAGYKSPRNPGRFKHRRQSVRRAPALRGCVCPSCRALLFTAGRVS